MKQDLTIHGFQTSNNIKVRVALGYKEIPYAFRTIDPEDRAEMVRLSGQSLTPVMVHGEIVLFDSAAIIRYLEANFRDRPSLFGAGKAEQWAIEELELFARHTLAAPMMTIVHRRVTGQPVDDALVARCSEEYAQATRVLKEHLGSRQWLVGDSMSVADVAAAATTWRVRKLGLFEPPGTEALADWESRVLAFDEHLNRTAS